MKTSTQTSPTAFASPLNLSSSASQTRASIFSRKLFQNGFFQLRAIGIISFCLINLPLIILLLGQLQSAKVSYVMDGSVSVISSMADYNPLSLAVVFLAVPVMTFYLFRFLTSRSASDFYFTVPTRRITLYLSYLASILAWALILIVSNTLISLLFALASQKYITVSLLAHLTFSLGCLCGSLLSCGGVLLGLCLTGSMFTSICCSGLILFLPRLLMYIIRMALINNISVLSTENYLFLNPRINLLTGILFDPNYMDEPFPMVYSAILGLLYLLLAGILFSRRKTERAGFPAISGVVFTCIISGVTLTICCLPIEIILGNVLSETNIYESDILICILLYLLAFGAFVVFTLIATRSMKAVLRSLPALALVVILNLVLIFGSITASERILAKNFDAEEITSIQLLDETQISSFSAIRSNGSYFYYLLSQAKVSDPQLNTLVHDSLAKSIASNNSPYYSQVYSDLTLNISSGSSTITRTLHYDTDEIFKQLLSAVFDDEAALDSFRDLPTPGTSSSSITASCNADIGGYMAGFTALKSTSELYKVFREEFRSLSADQLQNVLVDTADASDSLSFNIELSQVRGTRAYSDTYIVRQDTMPKTFSYLVQEALTSKDTQEMVQKVSTLLSQKHYFIGNNYMDLNLYKKDTGKFIQILGFSSDTIKNMSNLDDASLKLAPIIQNSASHTYEEGTYLLYFSLFYDENNYDTDGDLASSSEPLPSSGLMIILDEKDYEQLEELALLFQEPNIESR